MYVDKTKTDFPKSQNLQPFIWLRYTNNSEKFAWENSSKKITEELTQFLLNLPTKHLTKGLCF